MLQWHVSEDLVWCQYRRNSIFIPVSLLWSKNLTEFYSDKMNEFIYQTLLHMEENCFEMKPRIEEDQDCRHFQVIPLCGPQLPTRSLTKGQLFLICVSLPFSEEMCCEGQAVAMDNWVDLHFSGDSLCSSQQTSQARDGLWHSED